MQLGCEALPEYVDDPDKSVMMNFGGHQHIQAKLHNIIALSAKL